MVGSLRGRVVSLLGLGLGLLAVSAAPAADSEPVDPSKERLNVLLLIVDDLRPELGCYGAEVRSPSIDLLAERSLRFDRAYCQLAVCHPSRTSMLTGLRPDRLSVYTNAVHFRDTVPDAITLPQLFGSHGYVTQAYGKVFHGAFDDSVLRKDDPASWTEPLWRPAREVYFEPESIALAGRAKTRSDADREWPWRKGPAWEAPEIDDDRLYDGQVASRAVAFLRRHRPGSQAEDYDPRTFFLAVGFLRPHLPFVAPKRYWDLYQREDFSLPPNQAPPRDAPGYALSNWAELRQYHGIPQAGPLSDEQALALLHGYAACVSFVDAQVGRVLEELDRSGLRESTIVILLGDHGWHLGDHGMWCKHTNYEQATRSPLLFSVPGMASAGRSTSALVELVDLYPSLAELTGFPAPDELEGTSVVPLLDAPDRAWKSAVFHQFSRLVPAGGRKIRGMGRAVRDSRFRLVEWVNRDSHKRMSLELYDLVADPGETVNLASLEEYRDRREELEAKLRAGWRGALPADQ